MQENIDPLIKIKDKQLITTNFSVVNNSLQKYNSILNSKLMRDQNKSNLELSHQYKIQFPLELNNKTDSTYNKPLKLNTTNQIQEKEIRDVAKKAFYKAEKNSTITHLNKELKIEVKDQKNEIIKNEVNRRILSTKNKINLEKQELAKSVFVLVTEAREFSIKLKKERLEILFKDRNLNFAELNEIQEEAETKIDNIKDYQKNVILTNYGIIFKTKNKNIIFNDTKSSNSGYKNKDLKNDIYLENQSEFYINKDLLYEGVRRHINPVDLANPNKTIFDDQHYKVLRFEINREIMLIEERTIVKIITFLENKLNQKKEQRKKEKERKEQLALENERQRLLEMQGHKERLKKKLNTSINNSNKGGYSGGIFNNMNNIIIKNTNNSGFNNILNNNHSFNYNNLKASINTISDECSDKQIFDLKSSQKNIYCNNITDNQETYFLDNLANITNNTINLLNNINSSNNNKAVATLNSIKNISNKSNSINNDTDDSKIRLDHHSNVKNFDNYNKENIDTKSILKKNSKTYLNKTNIKEIEAMISKVGIFKEGINAFKTSTKRKDTSTSKIQSNMDKLQNDIKIQKAKSQYCKQASKKFKNIDLNKITESKNVIRLNPSNNIDKIIKLACGNKRKMKEFDPNTHLLSHFFNLKTYNNFNEAEKKVINDFTSGGDNYFSDSILDLC